MSLKDKELDLQALRFASGKVFNKEDVKEAVLELRKSINNLKGEILSKQTTLLMIENIFGDWEEEE